MCLICNVSGSNIKGEFSIVLVNLILPKYIFWGGIKVKTNSKEGRRLLKC